MNYFNIEHIMVSLQYNINKKKLKKNKGWRTLM